MARVLLLRLMAYRMRYITGIATYSVLIGAQYFVWQAVYTARDGAAVGGYNLVELTTYFAVGFMARAAYFTNIDSDIANRFKTGEVTVDLLRPINVHAYCWRRGREKPPFVYFFQFANGLCRGAIV